MVKIDSIAVMGIFRRQPRLPLPYFILIPIYTDWLIITHYVQYHSLHLFPIISHYLRTSDTGLKNAVWTL